MTDSTASLPAEVVRQLGIGIVPCTIHFGTDTFIDGVDPVAQFYSRLATSAEAPTTSQPSPGTFAEVYRQIAGEGDDIISIHVMGTKSGIVNTARLAAAMLPGVRVHVIDSRTTTVALGLLTICAARAVQAGHSAEEVLAKLARWIDQVHGHAAIRTLKQLRRSGRVSLGAALLGNLLAIKPLLYIGQNVVDVVDKARGWPAVINRMTELAQEKAGDARVILAVVHTGAEAEARELLDRIRPEFHQVESMVAEAGPTLATHAGPGALGIITLAVD